MSIKFTSARPIIEQRIKRNELSRTIYLKQIEVCNEEIGIKKMFIHSLSSKVKMINNMNDIERLQLTEYTEDRNKACTDIFNELEEMNTEIIERVTPFIEKIETKIT